MITRYKIDFFKKNWKNGVHLLIGTKHFGVNNIWWDKYAMSLFSVPWYSCINPFAIRRRYKMMRFRAVACYFVQYPEKLFKIRRNK